MAKAPAKKKGASRNRSAAASRKPIPGWLWMLVGVALTLFAVFLWYLQSSLKERSVAEPVAAVAPANADKAASANKKKADKKQPAASAETNSKKEDDRFDFYTLLPNQAVLPNGKINTAADPRPVAQYALQAGAFKSQVEAESRRAELLLQGMQVKVQSGNDGLFRVVVGPFDQQKTAEEARKTLKNNGVDTLLLKP